MAISKIGSKGITDLSVSADDLAPGTISNDKLAGSIANDKLANSSVTLNGTAVSLGGSADIGTQWQDVFVGDGSTGLTTVAGNGYFINTTNGAVTVTLPSSPSAGDTVILKDYARTWNTNNVTTASALFDGTTKSNTFSVTGQTVTLVYMDGTKGWSLTNEDTTSDLSAQYIAATGGTVTTTGNQKIHTFTTSGCFVVSCAGNSVGSDKVSYLVVAGGGGSHGHAGAGAGGFREGQNSSQSPYTASPLAANDGLPVSAQTYPITVGAGGSAGPSSTNGSNSVFSTITSAGGGASKNRTTQSAGGSGSGTDGGGPTTYSAGSGNTPPVSPPQGNPGGPGAFSNGNTYASGGGGGAATAGVPIPGPGANQGGQGGAGSPTAISGSATTYAGGGGGLGFNSCSANPASPSGGAGGGGNASYPGGPGGGPGTGGSANTGGGSGGGTNNAGGSGIVILRYQFEA